jgi:hypothetical protein
VISLSWVPPVIPLSFVRKTQSRRTMPLAPLSQRSPAELAPALRQFVKTIPEMWWFVPPEICQHPRPRSPAP